MRSERRSGKPRGITRRHRARTVQRLPAAERREALLVAALRVFAGGSYSGATTAEIAREAGVSEPILYRHFASKRELYLAVLEHVWAQLRGAWEEALDAAEPDEMADVLFATVRRLKDRGVVPSLLWVPVVGRTRAASPPTATRTPRPGASSPAASSSPSPPGSAACSRRATSPPSPRPGTTGSPAVRRAGCS